MNNIHRKFMGTIEVITGSMFSGKSEELIRRIKRAEYAKQKTVVFKHSIDDRYDGYIDALNNNDININSFIRLNPIYISNLSDYPSNDQIEEYLINWKKLKDRPTAIIALHDGVAMSIIIIAQKLGINIPEDLEVVGFDNLSISQNFTPSFTTTNPDFEKAGEVATRIALRQIREGFEYPQNYVLPVPLLIR